MMTRGLSIAIAVALGVTAVLSPGAAAQAGFEARRVTVGYADLNLATRAGRATLERRVKNAVSRVCGARPALMEIRLGNIYRACTDQALADSRDQMTKLLHGETLAENVIRVGAPNR